MHLHSRTQDKHGSRTHCTPPWHGVWDCQRSTTMQEEGGFHQPTPALASARQGKGPQWCTLHDATWSARVGHACEPTLATCVCLCRPALSSLRAAGCCGRCNRGVLFHRDWVCIFAAWNVDTEKSTTTRNTAKRSRPRSERAGPAECWHGKTRRTAHATH